MIALDDEQVAWFFNEYNCVGEVEEWLYNLDIHVKLTLQGYLVDAKSTAENWDIDVDKPRDIWIDDYCNQISLVITMIAWTEETIKVF